jgi:hypothetical protein
MMILQKRWRHPLVVANGVAGRWRSQMGELDGAICVHATDVAIGIATMAYHFSGNTGLRHPHVIGRLLRDLNTAGIHQVMSDTAYENHGKFRLRLPADPLA